MVLDIQLTSQKNPGGKALYIRGQSKSRKINSDEKLESFSLSR